tara:strand:+ start:1454 stop:3451 length:1998 start_codon:yes stop_codon:yes gene_type:complete
MADNENIVRIQTNFTAGEFDPLLRARIDLEQYRAAAQTLTNVVCMPQGGVERRPGLMYIGTIPSGASPQNGTRLVSFEFSTTQQYVFLFVSNRLYIYKQGTLQTNINSSGNDYLDLSSTGINSAKLATLYFAQSADTLIICHEDMNPVKITRGASHTSWTVSNITFDFVPYYPYSLATSNPAGTITPSAIEGTIEITFSSSVASSSYVHQYINAENGIGRARVVKFVSSTKVEAFVEIPFANTNAIANGDWELENGYELVWSSTRGFPRSCTFHEGRLFFGGSKSRPSTVWGSQVGQFFNFNPGQQLADESVEATLDTDQVNAIHGIISNRDLLVFTSGGEFFVPQGSLDPIEPNNIIFKVTTRTGSKQIKPIVADNATYFVQRQGNQLIEFVFTDSDVNYRSNNFSLFSSHLINNPVDMTHKSQISTSSTNRIILVNNDGSIACYSFLRYQQVVSPSKWLTDGLFKNVTTDFDEVYCVVQRTINSQTVYHLEKFDDDFTTDAATQFFGGTLPGSTSVTGLNYLEGKTVDVVRDDLALSQTTVSSGAITIDKAPTEYIEVGIPYTPTIVTLPVETRLPNGNVQGFLKRITEVNLILNSTQSIKVDTEEVPFRNLESLSLGTGIEFFTGLKTVQPLSGFTTDSTLTITQTKPLFFTLLGVEYKVSI